MLPNINVILGPYLVLGRFPKETRESISTVRLGGSSEARQSQMSSRGSIPPPFVIPGRDHYGRSPPGRRIQNLVVGGGPSHFEKRGLRGILKISSLQFPLAEH